VIALTLGQLIPQNIQIKACVVSRDERDIPASAKF